MKNVLLIDSGSGGLNVLKECVAVCPCCNFLMFCDDKNLPYGQKTKSELQKITKQNLENIKRFFDFDIVVFACNTLTCTCLDEAREQWKDVCFVGTVPAIKPALGKYTREQILVIATEATISHNILINKTKGIFCKPLPQLANLVDANLDNLWADEIMAYLQQSLGDFRGKFKAVVLGCTHYFALKEQIRSVLGDVEIFDSANGVARRLKFFVEQEKDATSASYQVQIMTSGNSNLLGVFWNFYNS